jgi:hypothetical protein
LIPRLFTLREAVTQAAKVAPFAAATKLVSEKAPQATFFL